MDTVKADTDSKVMRFADYNCNHGCPVEAALEQISGKWKGLVIYHLLSGTHRFSELKRKVGTVTQRSLTKQLRELESAGIIDRTVYAVVPPKVEYCLTEKGKRLLPVIETLHAWGHEDALNRS